MVNLGTIQGYVAGLIAAHPSLAGVPLIQDDGSFPKVPGREKALTTEGALIVVGRVDSRGVSQAAESGHARLEIYVPVMVEWNRSVSQNTTTGLNTSAADMAQYVIEATVGKPEGADERLRADEGEPFKNLENENGVHRMLVNLVMPKLITPV
jgi:hypothetical protein